MYLNGYENLAKKWTIYSYNNQQVGIKLANLHKNWPYYEYP